MSLAVIEVQNDYCTVGAEAPTAAIQELDRLMAYAVEGKQFVESYRKGWWDGKEHLVRLSRRTGSYVFPTGVLGDVLGSELADRFEFRDLRRRPTERRELAWIGKEPRDYQIAAADAALKDRGLASGRGILHLPIRAGKTLTASLMIHRLGVRTLFIVPSDILLHQTVQSIGDCVAGAAVGRCGAGIWDPQWITVATIQTLIAQPKRAAGLLASVDLLIVDEAHHMEAPEWRKPVLSSNAFYKIGLSATVFVNREIENERSAIWLKAATGPILYKVSMKRLMDEGYLVPPTIVLYPITRPEFSPRASYHRAYQCLIAENEFRNAAIADLAEAAAGRGLRVLIDSGRLSQIRRLKEMLTARHLGVEVITGKTPSHARTELLARFRRKEFPIVLGTVLGEGVDIPELEVVINAEAMKSKKSVIQRMRNLTECAGKRRALMVDFVDETHPKLKQHSEERRALYQGIRGFTVKEGEVMKGRCVLNEGVLAELIGTTTQGH
jgi:superfamily II DNA or RNA helicase